MKHNTRRALFGAAIGVCAAVSVAAIGMIAHEIGRYRESQAVYTELAALVEDTGPADMESEKNSMTTESPRMDFETLRAINPDVVGWLISEDSSINYPVVQGEDNVFYLNHHFDGSAGKAGCLYVDEDNRPGDENTIIYGHNLLDGSMFSSLLGYEEQEYYEDHPKMLLLTPEGNYTIEVFSAYTASTGDECWQTRFDSEKEYGEWLGRVAGRSTNEAYSEPEPEDRVVTLSTCTANGRARFVVHGLLVPFAVE